MAGFTSKIVMIMINLKNSENKEIDNAFFNTSALLLVYNIYYILLLRYLYWY